MAGLVAAFLGLVMGFFRRWLQAADLYGRSLRATTEYLRWAQYCFLLAAALSAITEQSWLTALVVITFAVIGAADAALQERSDDR